jgi:hypothetical protein
MLALNTLPPRITTRACALLRSQRARDDAPSCRCQALRTTALLGTCICPGARRSPMTIQPSSPPWLHLDISRSHSTSLVSSLGVLDPHGSRACADFYAPPSGARRSHAAGLASKTISSLACWLHLARPITRRRFRPCSAHITWAACGDWHPLRQLPCRSSPRSVIRASPYTQQ